MAEVYAVVMAGGRGERFWPLSTEKKPKPFIPLLGAASLIQETIVRLLPLVPAERILISVGESHSRVAREQLPCIPPENFIVEPMGRDTSACLGLCSLYLEKRNPDSIMLALPADHYIANPAEFLNTIQKGIRNLAGATGIVFGIKPVRPDPGYGYVYAEKPAIPCDAWPAVRFVEKPNARTAAEYLLSGCYFWNSGIFLWENRTLMRLFQKYLPDTYRGLCALRPLLASEQDGARVARIFSGLPRISIDFGILEKARGLRLVPADFAWDDIGNWAALARALPGDSEENAAMGQHISVESSNCLVYSDAGVVATLGVSGLVIVQANGRVLVCPKDRAADLKRLVSLLPPQNESTRENQGNENQQDCTRL